VASNDGFALADVDLEMRGEGTLLGARQKGRSDLRLARLKADEDLLLGARALAASMVASADESLAAMEDELRLFIDEDDATYLFKS
jgi:ATP-dependent DNA helicase RecG